MKNKNLLHYISLIHYLFLAFLKTSKDINDIEFLDFAKVSKE